MKLDQQKFNQWLADEVVWWCCEISADCQFFACSKGMKKLFSHPLRGLKDLTGEDEEHLIRLKIQELLDSSENEVRFVCSFNTRFGKSSFQHRLKVMTLGSEECIFAECVDVTEMVLFEQEMIDAQGRLSLSQLYERQEMLEEQNRVIQDSYAKQSRFLALLSHELRSPLLGISSMVANLKQHYPDDVYLNERLKVISLTSEQMVFLVNDILTYSQTEYDAITLHPRRFSLKQTFDYVKQLTKSIAAEKGVFVSLVYLGESDWVYGDGIRLSQILINLIVNGIKFTHAGGVSVEVRQQNRDHFSFMVMDSGEGIEAQKLPHIFDPFVQFKTEGATRTLGSGLGLSVVKQLIDVMGGDISVISTVGVGTRFNFSLRLPLAEDERELPSIEESRLSTPLDGQADEGSSGFQYRVLVVDDSQINRMVLSGFLKELECQVVEAQDGQQAWSLFQQQSFDIVFLDIQMPVMDGFAVMEKIQQAKLSGGADALQAVFAITAGGGEELIPDGHNLESLGFKKWLVKPISKAQVFELLESVQRKNGAIKSSEDETSETEDMASSLEKSVDWPYSMEEGDELQKADRIPEQFEHLASSFFVEMRANLSELDEKLKQSQWHEIKALAHYMKGNCMVFQLERWVKWLREIEAQAENELPEQVRKQNIAHLVGLIRKALNFLEKS
ncbi:ATP-binding protein [Thiomicrorhabdus sp. zzn3]|uniref:ATP-binding protein n=1 Tax=Thiomicrorhabdus sp. zzn3 TaxID=3039775 RepID=UPI002436D8BC|nr:ATP-binding protein [Thiomicrorhabdus sp. zzn3]MDG6777787.1 ATP-binding protein [Thiomicrorhabdus sp. zzn3]